MLNECLEIIREEDIKTDAIESGKIDSEGEIELQRLEFYLIKAKDILLNLWESYKMINSAIFDDTESPLAVK